MKQKQSMPLPKEVFVELFSNSEVMAEFLRALLDLTAKELAEMSVKVPEALAPDEQVRDNLLQVLTAGKKLINIELLRESDPNLLRATKRYGAKIALQMQEARLRGFEDDLPYSQVIQVHFLDFDEDSCGRRYHNQYVLWDNNKNELATDAYAYHVFVLPKLNQCQAGSDCRAWLEFLHADQQLVVESLAQEHEFIAQAAAVLKGLVSA